jgi:hypothetical protein
VEVRRAAHFRSATISISAQMVTRVEGTEEATDIRLGKDHDEENVDECRGVDRIGDHEAERPDWFQRVIESVECNHPSSAHKRVGGNCVSMESLRVSATARYSGTVPRQRGQLTLRDA